MFGNSFSGPHWGDLPTFAVALLKLHGAWSHSVSAQSGLAKLPSQASQLQL